MRDKIDHAHSPINLPGIPGSTAHFLIEAEEVLIESEVLLEMQVVQDL